LSVFNSKTIKVRFLKITPNKNWGGSGSLGGDVGFGN